MPLCGNVIGLAVVLRIEQRVPASASGASQNRSACHSGQQFFEGVHRDAAIRNVLSWRSGQTTG